jgi:hypothetical protein
LEVFEQRLQSNQFKKYRKKALLDRRNKDLFKKLHVQIYSSIGAVGDTGGEGRCRKHVLAATVPTYLVQLCLNGLLYGGMAGEDAESPAEHDGL